MIKPDKPDTFERLRVCVFDKKGDRAKKLVKQMDSAYFSPFVLEDTKAFAHRIGGSSVALVHDSDGELENLMRISHELRSPIAFCAYIEKFDVRRVVECIRSGVIDYYSLPLGKGFNESLLLAASARPALPSTALSKRTSEGDLIDLKTLTSREHEVLNCLAAGLKSGEIGTNLGISTRTVDVHSRHIFRKLGISKREDIIKLKHYF